MDTSSTDSSHVHPADSPVPPSFVGRTGELAELLGALPRDRAPFLRPWLIVGEAGIGKTRLVRELAVAAEQSGHQVAWGQCWDESGTPPYWPWTQIIRQLQGLDSGTDLARLVLGDEAGEPDPFALFDAVAAELRRAAMKSPTLVVLDDLHRADLGTLQLARFVVGHLADFPVQVVATQRHTALVDRPDIADHIESLISIGRAIDLDGLDLQAVTDMVGGIEEAPGIRAVTGGNPLHIQHLMRSKAQVAAEASSSRGEGHAVGGSTGPAASALGEVLSSRIGTIDAQSFDLLAALTVLGEAATHTSASALLGLGVDQVIDLAASLRTAGLIEAEGMRLAHGLVADAVDAVVAPDRTEDLHLAAALLAAATGAPIAQQAHHLCRAGHQHRLAAVTACREAAAVATKSFAHEDAITHLNRALELLDDDIDQAEARFEVSFALAGALERTKGTVAAEPVYRQALDAARETGNQLSVARAAARHGISFYADPLVQIERAEECRSALAGLSDGDSPLRARLLANLVAAEPLAQDRKQIAAQALEMARRTCDPETIGMALVAEQLVDLGPRTLSRRLRSSREIIALAESSGERDLVVRGRFLLKSALLEAGDVRELDAELAAQDRNISAIGEMRFARHVLWFRCMRAMLDGRALDAEHLAEQCFALSQQLQDPDGFGVYTGQYGVALWLQGRLVELEPIYVDLMHAEPENPLWPAVVAWIALDDNRPETARGLLSSLPDPEAIPGGMHTLLNLFTMADIAVAVGDDELATRVRDALLPYSDRAVPIGMGAACFGIVARPLGHLAIRLGRVDEGIAHFERAMMIAARMGARPWLTDSQLALAEVLIATGSSDRERIKALYAEAVATATGLGLTVFDQRIKALSEFNLDGPDPVISVTPARTDDSSRPSDRRARISVLGTFDVRTVDGERARWTSRKARSLLKILVARRGAPMAREQVMAMLWPDEDPTELGNRLAVAVSTVRRALDPSRSLSPEALIRADAGALCLVIDAIDLDVETFLDEAAAALEAHRSERNNATELLQAAIGAYQGEAMPDEPYEEWAEGLRSTTTAAFTNLLRALASRASDDDNHLLASETLRRLVELDPFDEPSHLALIESLRALGARGQARSAREHYIARMAELGIPVRDDQPETDDAG
ncbi:MAG: AAA family ATPase [Microthrixaceae bacterium]|nr:AAA family ATPase [Microthrixaceae bacterium]